MNWTQDPENQNVWRGTGVDDKNYRIVDGLNEGSRWRFQIFDEEWPNTSFTQEPSLQDAKDKVAALAQHNKDVVALRRDVITYGRGFVRDPEVSRGKSRYGGETYDRGSKASTPWGQADNAVIYAKGIASYSTPGHGGFKLSKAMNQVIPDYARNENGWYEEDCEWAKVAIFHPDAFTQFEREHAKDTLLHTYPELYETVFKVELVEGQSHGRDEQIFKARHAADFQVTSASTSDRFPGQVECWAKLGGRENADGEEIRVVIPSSTYGKRGRHGLAFTKGDFPTIEEYSATSGAPAP